MSKDLKDTHRQITHAMSSFGLSDDELRSMELPLDEIQNLGGRIKAMEPPERNAISRFILGPTSESNVVACMNGASL